MQILGWKPHTRFWLAPDRTPDEPLWQADPGAALRQRESDANGAATMTISTQAEQGGTAFEQLGNRFFNVGQACEMTGVRIGSDVYVIEGVPTVQVGAVIDIHPESASIEVIHDGRGNVWDLRRVE